MFTSTSQGDILIDFDNEEVVGIKLSGGMDSAIVFYMVCKHIQENNLQTAILLMTVDKPGHGSSNSDFAKKVLYWMKQNFPTVKILSHQLDKAPDTAEDWATAPNMDWARREPVDEWIYHQEKQIYETHQHTPFNIYFTGITNNPPEESYSQFYNSKEELLEGPDDNRSSSHPITIEHPYFLDTDGYWKLGRTNNPEVKQGEMICINLLAHVDKIAVAELYDKFNLRQRLLPNTRSCENDDPVLTNNFTTHCNTECWWCHERHWGLGNQNKY